MENFLLSRNCGNFSSDELPGLNSSVEVNDEGGGDGDDDAEDDMDGDDFVDTDDNNFEMQLRRRKGKIINCAKETIEHGNYYNWRRLKMMNK